MCNSAGDAPVGVHGAAAAPAVIALPHTGISLRGKNQVRGSESPAHQPAAVESITAGDGDQTAAASSALEGLDQSATPADEQSPGKQKPAAAGTRLAPHSNVSEHVNDVACACCMALPAQSSVAAHAALGTCSPPFVPNPSLRCWQWHRGRRVLEVLAAGGAHLQSMCGSTSQTGSHAWQS
jgi:hypothetical protein